MGSRKHPLRGNQPRAVLSDVLPYELPITFDNSGFYQLLSRMQICKIDDETMRAKWIGPATPSVLQLIFGQFKDGHCRAGDGRTYSFQPQKNYARALTFSIGRATGNSRQVSIPHPTAQFDMHLFYKKYGESILHFTNRSPYSIRHPRQIARYSVTKDPKFEELQSHETTGVEESELEYRAVRSYFTYASHSHIYKFYASAEFRALERKYGYLVKADITRCFDSIYTHSISWVTNGYDTTKNNTNETERTFGGRFDKLMQRANFNETNGILIGPEVSRIFAEIILQEVDVRVERSLAKQRIFFRKDYEVQRFVDDYFIFLRRPEHGEKIVAAIGNELLPFKLHLNASKRTEERTPLRSQLTVAKHRILHNLSEHLRLEAKSEDGKPEQFPHVSAQILVLEYKSTLLASQLEHSELANYALSQLEIGFEKAMRASLETLDLSEQDHPDTGSAYWNQAAKFMFAIIDTAVFLYAGAETVSHSVKLARILTTALRYIEATKMPPLFSIQVKSRIAVEISAQVRRHIGEELSTPAHSLVLLDCLTSMGNEFALNAADLEGVLGLNADTDPSPFNAIGILTALRHCGDINNLAHVKRQLEDLSIGIIRKTSAPLDANKTLLTIGIVTSPFTATNVARDALRTAGIDDSHLGEIRRTMKDVHFRWTIDNYYEALQEKRSNEVY